MSHTEHVISSNIVAVFPDHDAAERIVRRLHEAGIPMCDLSIIGRGSQTTEEPVGFVSALATMRRLARPPERGLEACWGCAWVPRSWYYPG